MRKYRRPSSHASALIANPLTLFCCVQELRFHLSLLYEVRDPYRAFSIARLLKSSPSAADQRNTYDGDYNAKGEYHGRGRLLLPGGEVSKYPSCYARTRTIVHKV